MRSARRSRSTRTWKRCPSWSSRSPKRSKAEISDLSRGNSATGKCEIVTGNPVISGQVGGNIWFGGGPHNSLDDAKLARSTIHVCPAGDDPPAAAGDDVGKPG